MGKIEEKIYPFSLGILSFGYQVVLLREIISLYDILAFSGLFFALWFFWGWRGVLSGEKEVVEKENIGGYFFLSYFGFALSLVFVKFFRFIFKKEVFENLNIWEILLLLSLSTLFPAFYSGKLFSVITKSLPIESVKLYKKEIVGSFFAGIFIYYGAIGKFSNWQIAGILGFYIVAVFVLFLEKGLKRLFILLFIAPIFTFMLIDEPMLMKKLYSPYRVVFSFETTHGKYKVFELNSQYYFYENTNLRFFLPYNYEDEKRILLPLLFVGKEEGNLFLYEKNPKTATEILKVGNYFVDYLFGEKGFCRKLFIKFPQIFTYLKEKSFNTHCSNPDSIMKDRKNYYDIIYYSNISPEIETENHFITYEFLKLTKKALKKNGYLIVTILMDTNFINKKTKKGVLAIKKTLELLFPNVFIGLSDGFVFFISGTRIKEKEKIIGALKTNPNIFTIHPFDVEKVFSPVAKIKLELNNKEKIGLNTFVYPHALYYFRSKLFSEYKLKSFFLMFENRWFKYILAFILFFYFFVLIKYKNTRKRVSILIVSGFSIYSDVFLFFLFQEKFGYIYSYLVLIITMFFTGLIFGIFSADRTKKESIKVMGEVILLIIFVVFAKLFFSYKISYLIFSFLVGSLNSFVFIKASKHILGKNKFSSKTYAMDLFGALIGALFFSIVCLNNAYILYPALFLLPLPFIAKE